MNRKVTISVSFVAALLGTTAFLPAHAQGILGSMLRAAGSSGSSSNRLAKLDFVTELRLSGSQWVVQSQTDRGDSYPSPLACRANLSSDARLILSNSAARPLAEKFLRPNAVVVKDGAEADAPVWKISVLSCGGGSAQSGRPLDPATAAAFSGSGIEPNALFSEASEYIRRTDGSFPPPLTAADVAQNQRDQKYLFTVVDYDPSGQMFQSRSGTLFDTAQECDRFAGAQLTTLAHNIHATIAGDSVLVANDASGYSWLGCLHPNDVTSPAAIRYFSVKMTDAQARLMRRFPEFATSRANPPSQRGKHVKI